MDRTSLFYLEDVLMNDVSGLRVASQSSMDIPDDIYKRALNIQIEAIQADLTSIVHLLET